MRLAFCDDDDSDLQDEIVEAECHVNCHEDISLMPNYSVEWDVSCARSDTRLRTGLPGSLYRLPPPTHCWRRRIKFPISAFVYFYSVKLVLISGVTQEQDVTQSFLTQRLNYNDQHREKCDDVQVSSVMCYCIEPDSHPTSYWCSSDTSYAIFFL